MVIILIDGSTVSWFSDLSTIIWNIKSNQCEIILLGPNDFIICVAELPTCNSKLVSKSTNKTINLLNFKGYKKKKYLALQSYKV